MFFTNIADGWIQTLVLWHEKRLQCQLCTTTAQYFNNNNEKHRLEL